METLVLVGLLCWLGYVVLKNNTKRGAETVRAYVYLGGLMAGENTADANKVADYDMSVVTTEVIQGAKEWARAAYGGKQSAMIADAYRKGMTPKLAKWYSNIITARA